MTAVDAPVAVWVNGRPGGAVSAIERGLHYGDGLFETIACVGGRPRFLALHLARLARGCARLGFEFPDREELEHEILAAAAAAAPGAIVKVLLTRGPAVARGYASTGAEQPTRVTLCYRWDEEPRARPAGIRVRTAALRLGENPALAGLKHLNRLEQVLARREWSDGDIAEALMFSASGRLISGVMSNVFLVEGQKLRTPLLDRCGVAGIMRQVVLREAARAGIATEEAPLEAEDLARAREIFVTSAVIGLRPVGALDGRACEIGALTRELQQLVAPLLAEAGDG